MSGKRLIRSTICVLAPLALAVALAESAEPTPRSIYIPAASTDASCLRASVPDLAPSQRPTPSSVMVEVTSTLGPLGTMGFNRPPRFAGGAAGYEDCLAPEAGSTLRARAYHLSCLGPQALLRHAADGTESSPHTAPPSTLR